MSGILNSRPTTESGLSDGLNKRGRNLTKLSSPALLHITDEMSAAMDSSKQKIWKDVLKSYENGVLDSGDVISRAQEFLPNQKRLLNALKNYFVTERETYEAEEDDDDDDMDDDDDDEDDDDDMDDAILEQDDLDNEDDEDINSCVDDDMDDNTQPSISARASSLTRIDIDFLQQQQQHHIGNMEEGLFMESNEPPLAFTDDVDLVNHHHHITSSSSIPITNIPAVNIASSRKRQNSYGSGGGRQVGSASSRRRRVLSNALSNNTNNANKMPVNKRSRIVSGNSVTCKTSSYAGGESSSDEDSLHDNSVLIRPRRSNLSRNVRHNRSPGEDDLTRQHGEFDSDESNEPCMATERATLTSASNERCCVSYYRLRPNQRPQMSLDPIGREVLNTEYVSCPRFESELVEDDSADERDLDKPSINTTSNTHERGGGGRPNSAWPQIAGSTNRTNTMEELLGDDHIQLRSPGVPTATRIAGGGTGPGSIAPQEHLFQVEDERYEMDNVVDLNNYAIAELLTLKHRIQAKPQLAEFQPGNFSLEGSLGCSYASVYRGLHRLYGDRVDEIIHGVSVCPDRGVGLLLTRLKQKSREWGHVRRFFQRKWFDVTLNWHYRALDILGWSGKPRNEDYVQFRGRALLEDVVQHAKQQQSREMSGGNVEKSGSAATSGATDAPAVVAPAPAATAAATVASAAVHVNHHFSLTCACMKWPCASASSSTAASSIKPAGTAAAAVPQVNPIEDAVFLVVHSVRRIPNAYKDDKSIMKKIIRTAVPPLFHASPLPMSEDEAEEDDSIKATKKDVKKEDPMIVDISEDEPEQAMPAADPPTEAATTPNSLSAPPATAHNWWHGGPIDERRIEPLRQLIFGVGGYQKQLQHLELADYLARRTDCSGPHYVFYANDQWLLLLRLFHILYDRLCYFARLSEQMRLDDEVEKEQRDRVGAAINLEELMGRSLNPHFCQDRYRLFMHQLLELMDGAIENSAYEDMLRELFGIHAYRLYSLDKLISSLVKHLQNCALNDIGLALLSLQNHFRLESAKATTTPTEVEQLEKLYEQLALLVCNCPAILKATPQETNSSSSAHVGEHTTDPSTGEGSGINASAAAAPPTTSTDRASDQLQQQQHFLKETTVVSSGGDVKPPSRDAIFAPMMMMMPAITTDSKASSSSLLLTSQFLDDCKQNVSSCFRMIFLPNLSQLWIQLLDKITFDKSSSSKTMPNLSAAQSTLAKLHPVKQLPALDLNKEVHTWEDYLVRYLHLGMNNDNCPSPPQESSSIASSTTNNIPATTTAACSQATHDVAARCLYTKLRNVPLFRVQTVRKIILSIANTSPTEAAALAQAVKIKEESMDFEVVQEVKQTKEEEAVPLPEPPPPVIHLPEEMMKQEKSDSAFDSLSSPELLNMEIVNSGLKKDTCQLVKRIFRQDLMTERVFHNTFCTDRMERRDWSTARTLWSARSYGIFVRSCPLRSRKFQPSSDRFKQFHANWIQNNVSSTAALASNVDAIFQRLRETKEESV